MTHIGPSNYALIEGYVHYIDTDGMGRAAVGIVRHGARGLLNRKGRLVPRSLRRVPPSSSLAQSTSHRQSREKPLTTRQPTRQLPHGYNAATPHPLAAHHVIRPRTEPKERHFVEVEEGPTVPIQRLTGAHKAFFAALAFLKAYVRVTDEDWHRTARQTAGTIAIWAFVIGAVLILGKAVVVVMML